MLIPTRHSKFSDVWEFYEVYLRKIIYYVQIGFHHEQETVLLIISTQNLVNKNLT